MLMISQGCIDSIPYIRSTKRPGISESVSYGVVSPRVEPPSLNGVAGLGPATATFIFIFILFLGLFSVCWGLLGGGTGESSAGIARLAADGRCLATPFK